MRFLVRLPDMTGDVEPRHAALRPDGDEQAPNVFDTPQRAAVRFGWKGRFEVNAEVQVTPAGLLSIGGLVGVILLGSAVIVRVAGQAHASGKADREWDG